MAEGEGRIPRHCAFTEFVEQVQIGVASACATDFDHNFAGSGNRFRNLNELRFALPFHNAQCTHVAPIECLIARRDHVTNSPEWMLGGIEPRVPLGIGER